MVAVGTDTKLLAWVITDEAFLVSLNTPAIFPICTELYAVGCWLTPLLSSDKPR